MLLLLLHCGCGWLRGGYASSSTCCCFWLVAAGGDMLRLLLGAAQVLKE
jgi:hypothetical protein